MAVGLTVPESVDLVSGVRLASVAAGIKASGSKDLVLIELAEGTQAAAVFTKNAFCAAPVLVAKQHLSKASPRALLINSGNANAGTGAIGIQNAEGCCQQVADLLGINPEQVLPFSTGVIGPQLDMSLITSGLQQLVPSLDADAWFDAAHGILTTDTLPKIISRQLSIDDTTITINGISKGSGMICPDMATMLAYIVTDAAVGSDALQACLESSMTTSFNAITVDSDTSTNDACVLCATASAGGLLLSPEHADWSKFCEAVQDVCQFLAQAIIRDGEGATKFITVDVEGGASVEECRAVAYTLAHSPLVKTAFFASDANLGRILAAIGRSPVKNLEIDLINFSLDEVSVVEKGQPAESYTEQRGQMVMDREEITIKVSLGRGHAKSQVWTCDLSNEYVRINAEYRS